MSSWARTEFRPRRNKAAMTIYTIHGFHEKPSISGFAFLPRENWRWHCDHKAT